MHDQTPDPIIDPRRETVTGWAVPAATLPSAVTRRRFLSAAAITGGGLVAAAVAACAPSGAAPGWTYGPTFPPAGASGSPSAATPTPAPSAVPSEAPSPSPSEAPYLQHDANAAAVVKRFLDGEWTKVEGYGNGPIEPKLDGDVKVYDLSVDAIDHRIDAIKDPLKALGYNGTWPGPRIEVVEGDKVRVNVTNKLDESTSVHWHGQRVPNAMDGVPYINQEPIKPGETFVYEFTARVAGSHMYHSHHNATDQVGRGLLGALIVQPKDPAKRYDRLYGATQDLVWISNDSLGGFTINGRGFPATAPLVATLGEKIVVRFMNEGNMMHPWHLHGMNMRVIARDGYPLGGAAFNCDTLGVNPGERYDVLIDCDEPGAWAFHCHILPHVEGPDGMFGMVTALVVQPQTASAETASAEGPIVAAARAAGSQVQFDRLPASGSRATAARAVAQSQAITCKLPRA
jgi:FtsP/CotA-like multicopper oxidase with cupredoxin domain